MQPLCNGRETDGAGDAVSGMQLDAAWDAANVRCGESGGKGRGSEWAGARADAVRELAATTRGGEG
jgi:hypothetical protein